MPEQLPIDNCQDCLKVYPACPACGRSGWHQTRANPGEQCTCGRGIVKEVKHRFCCRKDWHKLGTTCTHCGQEG